CISSNKSSPKDAASCRKTAAEDTSTETPPQEESRTSAESPHKTSPVETPLFDVNIPLDVSADLFGLALHEGRLHAKAGLLDRDVEYSKRSRSAIPQQLITRCREVCTGLR